MSTYPICSECSEILWELAEVEAKMCRHCQKIACQNIIIGPKKYEGNYFALLHGFWSDGMREPKEEIRIFSKGACESSKPILTLCTLEAEDLLKILWEAIG